MKFDKKSLLLYAVTDRRWVGEKSLYEQIESAVKGGATFVQLREKELDDESFCKEAKEIQALCRKYKVPFVINDNEKIAKKINADGVHVGQSDTEAEKVRAFIGKDKILGVSVQTPKQAVLAQKFGADYLGVGSVFHTVSKSDADNVSYNTLKEICDAVSIPVVAIGGISRDNIAELKESGICGIAVISAIFAADDIEAATAELKETVQKNLKIR